MTCPFFFLQNNSSLWTEEEIGLLRANWDSVHLNNASEFSLCRVVVIKRTVCQLEFVWVYVCVRERGRSRRGVVILGHKGPRQLLQCA